MWIDGSNLEKQLNPHRASKTVLTRLMTIASAWIFCNERKLHTGNEVKILYPLFAPRKADQGQMDVGEELMKHRAERLACGN